MSSAQQQPMLVLTDLPDDLYTKIGMVVVQFSYLEWIINRIVYDLKNLDTPAGRQISFGRQIKERLNLLFKLVDERGLTTAVDRMALRRDAIECEGWRDLLSHAIFVRDQAGTLMVRKAKRGRKWQPQGRLGLAVDMSIEPAGYKIDSETVSTMAHNIAIINRVMEGLWAEIAAQLTDSRFGKI